MNIPGFLECTVFPNTSVILIQLADWPCGIAVSRYKVLSPWLPLMRFCYEHLITFINNGHWNKIESSDFMLTCNCSEIGSGRSRHFVKLESDRQRFIVCFILAKKYQNLLDYSQNKMYGNSVSYITYPSAVSLHACNYVHHFSTRMLNELPIIIVHVSLLIDIWKLKLCKKQTLN
jgi:hypothetical protein